MFRALVNDVKSAAGSLVAKYVVRASVAVPFLVAFGFATAAVTLMLVDRYGAIAAYWMVAAGFTAIGLVSVLVVSVKEQEEEVANARAEKTDTNEVKNAAVAQAAAQAPLALLGALLSTPLGPGVLAGGGKMLARNVPLVVLMAAIGLLLWPIEPKAPSTADADAMDRDNADREMTSARPALGPMANGRHREAA
jgi:uncharacterized membrane protein